MTTSRLTRIVWLAAAAACAFAISAPSASRADIAFAVNMDTSPLLGSVAGPFYVDFQLNDGSGTGDGNNSVTVSNFTFGGGSPAGSPSLTGGASGDLTTQVSITDTAPILNEFIQQFAPGGMLNFTVHLSTNVETPNPDQFYFSIMDCNQIPLPTLGPADGVLIVNLDSSTPTIQTFAGDPNRSPSCGGPPIPLLPPLVNVIPEPSPLVLGAGAATVFGWLAGARRYGLVRRLEQGGPADTVLVGDGPMIPHSQSLATARWTIHPFMPRPADSVFVAAVQPSRFHSETTTWT